MSPTILSCPERPFSPPFLYEELTNEPYLPLPPPLGPRFRLTPPRISDEWPSSDEPNDIPRLVELLNIKEVNFMLTGPPFPFTAEHAMARFMRMKQTPEQALEKGESPVPFVRERLEDGTDLLLGNCSVHRSRFHDILDQDERLRLTEANLAYEPGDPRIIYSFAYILAPSHQNRGITSAAVHTLIHDWAIPHLKAKTFIASTLDNNVASGKVFLKNGFKLVRENHDSVDLTALGKGEGKVGGKVYELIVE